MDKDNVLSEEMESFLKSQGFVITNKYPEVWVRGLVNLKMLAGSHTGSVEINGLPPVSFEKNQASLSEALEQLRSEYKVHEDQQLLKHQKQLSVAKAKLAIAKANFADEYDLMQNRMQSSFPSLPPKEKLPLGILDIAKAYGIYEETLEAANKYWKQDQGFKATEVGFSKKPTKFKYLFF